MLAFDKKLRCEITELYKELILDDTYHFLKKYSLRKPGGERFIISKEVNFSKLIFYYECVHININIYTPQYFKNKYFAEIP